MKTDTFFSPQTENAVLPLPPESLQLEAELALYARFMQHLRQVPTSRMDIKILSSIRFTADMMGHSEAHVAKVLIDLGLRAPRMAFPGDFLNFADAALMRSGWEVGGPSPSLLELRKFWDGIGEDRFAPFKKYYSLLDERAVVGH